MKRYEPDYYDGFCMREEPTGEYVKLEDLRALIGARYNHALHNHPSERQAVADALKELMEALE